MGNLAEVTTGGADIIDTLGDGVARWWIFDESGTNSVDEAMLVSGRAWRLLAGPGMNSIDGVFASADCRYSIDGVLSLAACRYVDGGFAWGIEFNPFGQILALEFESNPIVEAFDFALESKPNCGALFGGSGRC